MANKKRNVNEVKEGEKWKYRAHDIHLIQEDWLAVQDIDKPHSYYDNPRQYVDDASNIDEALEAMAEKIDQSIKEKGLPRID